MPLHVGEVEATVHAPSAQASPAPADAAARLDDATLRLRLRPIVEELLQELLERHLRRLR